MEKTKIEAFKLIGISVRTTNENGQSAKDITDLWNKFMSEDIINKIPNKVDNNIYSLYTEYESDHTQAYTAIIGCKVKDLNHIPNEMVGKLFEDSNYVKITAKGDLTEGLIVKEWYKIWDMELDRKYSADFEIYGKKAQNPKSSEVDILIAVN